MHRVNFSSPRSYSALGQYAHSVSLVAACVALAASTVNAQEPPASDSTTLQTIVVKSARAAQEKDVYTASKSSVYISAEEVERFGQTSPGDVLKGQPGVQVGDNRNGGALDVNIRGIQGQNRVAVMVDGAQQSINAYRGYAGTQQRSYIDTDFIGGILIEKGPSLAANAAGSIGGRVQVNTIEVDDIVAEGRDYGIRLKGDLADNSVVPPPAGNNALPRDEASYSLDDLAKSGSIAAGYKSDGFDVVVGYARRFQGNYFAGSNGRDRYRRFERSGKEEHTVGKVYKDGEEVMNTSRDTESAMLKRTFRPTDEQELTLGYQYFDGRFGEVMPSVIIRGTDDFDPLTFPDTIPQWPLGKMNIDTFTAHYTYDPADNDLVNITANAWATIADSELLNASSTYAPESQHKFEDGPWGPYAIYAWRRQHSQRFGVDLANKSEFDTQFGAFVVDLGISYQNERLEPADGVLITENDLLNNRVVTNGSREEVSLSGQVEFKPTDYLALRAGGRFLNFRTRDDNRYSQRNSWGGDLPGGPVFDEPQARRDSGFAPAVGVTLNVTEDSFVYANYSQGLRMPGLFESTMGTDALLPAAGLDPERARSWEVGASTTQTGLIRPDDEASFKLAYFNTSIKDYVTRFYNPMLPEPGADFREYEMTFYNADSFEVSGLEFQSKYEVGPVFADLSATYYFSAKTCDAETAGKLRAAHSTIYGIDTANTPNCTNGGFSGSYANSQNPPQLSVNLTVGTRLLDDALTVGTRMTYTGGPTEKLDETWNGEVTTLQLYYEPVTTFDLFATYRLRENAELRASIDNVTDRYYLDPLAQSLMPAPGRTFRANLTMKF
jgi:hemoglobin/transferrin/lactoferrin receptor protein